MSPLALLLLAIGGSACGDGDVRERPVGIEVGSAAPGFQGRTAEGETFAFVPDERATLLVFYSGGYCSPCRERLGALQRYTREYEEAEVRVVAVTAETLTEANATARSAGARFPIVSVDSASLSRWGVWKRGSSAPRPASYLVDGEGVIVFRHVGSHAADAVLDRELLRIARSLRGR